MLAVPRRGGRCVLATGVELFARVLADRLQHPVAAVFLLLLQHHQRLLHQRADQVEHVERVDRLGTANRLGRGEVEAADEYTEPLQQALLFVVEKVVGPVHQRAQRLLPGLQGAGAPGEQLEAVLQPDVDVGDRQQLDPRRRQFQRQRDALQPRH